MNTLPNNVVHNIWKFIYPVKDIQNNKIDDTINNILTKTGYCYQCGENNKSRNCGYCNTVLYYYCRNCMYSRGDDLMCCYDSYKNNFIF